MLTYFWLQKSCFPLPFISSLNIRKGFFFVFSNPVFETSRTLSNFTISDSPRIYISSNPWKITASFKAVSSTREEYIAVVESLKSTAPKKRKTKTDAAHLDLVECLQERVEVIDRELAVSMSLLFPRHIPLLF